MLPRIREFVCLHNALENGLCIVISGSVCPRNERLAMYVPLPSCFPVSARWGGHGPFGPMDKEWLKVMMYFNIFRHQPDSAYFYATSSTMAPDYFPCSPSLPANASGALL